MNTKTIRVADATNTQLDWLIAKASGAEGAILAHLFHFRPDFHPTTNPAMMWPIIERAESYTLKKWAEARPDLAYQCHIWDGEVDYQGFGPTALIAASRCYVASKLGETAEVPEELE